MWGKGGMGMSAAKSLGLSGFGSYMPAQSALTPPTPSEYPSVSLENPHPKVPEIPYSMKFSYGALWVSLGYRSMRLGVRWEGQQEVRFKFESLCILSPITDDKLKSREKCGVMCAYKSCRRQQQAGTVNQGLTPPPQGFEQSISQSPCTPGPLEEGVSCSEGAGAVVTQSECWVLVTPTGDGQVSDGAVDARRCTGHHPYFLAL